MTQGGGNEGFAPWEGSLRPTSERSVKSAERTLAIFEMFSVQQAPMTVGQIARTLDIPQPSTTMLLRNLVRLGYLEHNRADRTYLPTVRVMLLGSWIHRKFHLENDIERHLDALVEQCGETVLLGLQNSLYCQYVCAQVPDVSGSMDIQSGMLRPLTRTALGRVLLSMKSDAEIELLVRRSNAEFGPAMHVDQTTLFNAVREVQQSGIAESHGEMTPGRCVIAVAIPSVVGNVPMAIGIGGTIERIASKRATIIDALQQTREGFVSAAMSEADAAGLM